MASAMICGAGIEVYLRKALKVIAIAIVTTTKNQMRKKVSTLCFIRKSIITMPRMIATTIERSEYFGSRSGGGFMPYGMSYLVTFVMFPSESVTGTTSGAYCLITSIPRSCVARNMINNRVVMRVECFISLFRKVYF